MRFQSSDFRFRIGFQIGFQIGVALVVGALGAAARAETIDRVLAVVANQLITLSDVTAAIDLGLQSTDGTADPVRAVLTKLIDRELVLAEVERYAPAEPTAEQVDREVQRVQQRLPTPAGIDHALGGQSLPGQVQSALDGGGAGLVRADVQQAATRFQQDRSHSSPGLFAAPLAGF